MKRVIFSDASVANTMDIHDFIGKSKSEIYDILDAAEVGTTISGIVNRWWHEHNNSTNDTFVRKESAYKSNYYQGVSSPHDWKYKSEYWTLGSHEEHYLGTIIYNIVNGNNDKYYMMLD